MRHCYSKPLFGICLLLLVASTLFVSPGWRHAHQGGEEPHSHTHSHHGDHSYAAHGHSSHDHGEHKHQDDGDLQPSQSHIHITFLWFQLTISDLLEGNGSSANSSDHASEVGTGSTGELVGFRMYWSFGQLIQAFLVVGNSSNHYVNWRLDHLTTALLIQPEFLFGRLPDAPATPPPKSV